MGLTHFPNGVASFGIPQMGNGDIPTGGGKYIFVDSNNGSDGYDGSWDAPMATLDAAVAKCTANEASVIVLMPNHAESITADSGVDIDVAGVQVIGLGTGADRPTFTFTTAVTADFKLAANNVSIRNILFVAGIDALTGPIEVSADDCAIVNCEYQEDTVNNYETVDVIVTASTPLRLLIDGFKYVCDGGAGGTQNQSVIQLNGADGAIIRNCWLVADSGTGVIEDATTSDQILVENCTIENSETSPTPAITATATTTGSVVHCNLRVASGTTYVTATTDLQYFETFGTGTDNTAGEKVGTQLAGDIEAKIDVIDGYHDVATADAATNAVMSDVIGNKADAAAAGAVSATESLVAYAKQNVTNTEKIGTIVNAGGTATIGGVFGDFANDTLAARLDDIGSDVDSATTDNIQGKIGTDTELADRSLYDILNGAGPAAMATAAAPANDVSLAAMIRDIWDALRNGTGGSEPGTNTSIVDILSGTGGIVTWPDPVKPADAVSLAEAIRMIASRQGVINGFNPLGKVVYVAASGGNDSATGGGEDPTEPYATIAAAITSAGAGGTVVLGPGTHSVDVSAAALIPLANQKFIAAVPPKGGRPTTIITADADDGADLVTVDVDGVSFEGIRFLLVAGGTTAVRLTSISQTTAVSGLTFTDCEFDLNDVDASVTAIAANDATNATTGLMVNRCRFRGGSSTTGQAIYVDVGVGGIPSALIEHNIFECESADADALAVNFADPAASNKSYGWTFRHNDVIGPADYGNDGVPIVFAGAMTEGEIVGMIRNNFFSCTSATPITQDEANQSIINNYVGDAATGGTLVDPGT